MRFEGNRFIKDDAVIIAKDLSKNKTLQELRLGNNPLGAQGASALIHAITPHQSPDSTLRLLDMENIWANKDVLHDLETIRKFRPWLAVKLGGILSNYQVIGPNVRKILLKRANYEAMLPKQKKQKRNFGFFVMSLNDTNIPQGMSATVYFRFFLHFLKTDEKSIACIKKNYQQFSIAVKFKQLVQKFMLKLSTSLVEEIMKAFEGPQETVDQQLLKSFYLKEYPETTAELLKLNKRKLKNQMNKNRK